MDDDNGDNNKMIMVITLIRRRRFMTGIMSSTGQVDIGDNE